MSFPFVPDIDSYVTVADHHTSQSYPYSQTLLPTYPSDYLTYNTLLQPSYASLCISPMCPTNLSSVPQYDSFWTELQLSAIERAKNIYRNSIQLVRNPAIPPYNSNMNPACLNYLNYA